MIQIMWKKKRAAHRKKKKHLQKQKTDLSAAFFYIFNNYDIYLVI